MALLPPVGVAVVVFSLLEVAAALLPEVAVMIITTVGVVRAVVKVIQLRVVHARAVALALLLPVEEAVVPAEEGLSAVAAVPVVVAVDNPWLQRYK